MKTILQCEVTVDSVAKVGTVYQHLVGDELRILNVAVDPTQPGLLSLTISDKRMFEQLDSMKAGDVHYLSISERVVHSSS